MYNLAFKFISDMRQVLVTGLINDHNRILSFSREHYIYSTLLTATPFPQLEFQHRKRGHCPPCGQFSPRQAVSPSQLALERFCRVLRTALSRDVSRVNTRAHTRDALHKAFMHLSFSLSLSVFPSRVQRTLDSIAHQPARSWFSCSGVTCPRRISTVTFYRFLRSPPSAFTVKTADFQRLSRGTYCVLCKTSVDSRRIETKFRASLSAVCTNMRASRLCFAGSVCLACR